jgi:hypothetical protein
MAIEAEKHQEPVIHRVSIGIKQGQDMKFAKPLITRVVSWLKSRRRRPVRDLVEAVAKELWPPHGHPPETMSNAKALRTLGDKLDSRNIKAEATTLLRAIGRRPD